MKAIKITALVAAGLTLSACAEGTALGAGLEGGQRTGQERWVDAGRDSKSLSQLVAGVWVDPNGCDHWIIDDGVEGYLSQRLDDYGRPVCSGLPPNTATGPFKEGSNIADTL